MKTPPPLLTKLRDQYDSAQRRLAEERKKDLQDFAVNQANALIQDLTSQACQKSLIGEPSACVTRYLHWCEYTSGRIVDNVFGSILELVEKWAKAENLKFFWVRNDETYEEDSNFQFTVSGWGPDE